MNHFCLSAAVGSVVVIWNTQGLLTRIDWCKRTVEEPSFSVQPPLGLRPLIFSLSRFLAAGEPLGDVPWSIIDQTSWTEFQREVYRVVAQIPHGETRTYAWVAQKLGRVGSARAVGQALRKNPLPVLIPCHRVVSAKTLGGFMGCVDPSEPEMQFKSWLIEKEYSFVNPVFSFFSEIAPAF